jgi:hypothetical protein
MLSIPSRVLESSSASSRRFCARQISQSYELTGQHGQHLRRARRAAQLAQVRQALLTELLRLRIVLLCIEGDPQKMQHVRLIPQITFRISIVLSERVWPCAVVALRGKMSKIEEDFFGSVCYASQEAPLDFSKTR